MHSEESTEGTWWIARPENANKVFWGLCISAIALVVTDLAYVLWSRYATDLHHIKGHHDFEDIIGFHAAYGFMAFVLVVLSGTKLREFLMRDLTYYDVPYTPPDDDHHGHDDHGHGDHDDEHGDDEHGDDEHDHDADNAEHHEDEPTHSEHDASKDPSESGGAQ